MGCHCDTRLRHQNPSYTTDCRSAPWSHSAERYSIEGEVICDFQLDYGGDIKTLTARLHSHNPVWCCVKLHGLGHVWYSFCPEIITKCWWTWSVVLPDVSSFVLLADKVSAVAISLLPKGIKFQWYVKLCKDSETHCIRAAGLTECSITHLHPGHSSMKSCLKYGSKHVKENWELYCITIPKCRKPSVILHWAPVNVKCEVLMAVAVRIVGSWVWRRLCPLPCSHLCSRLWDHIPEDRNLDTALHLWTFLRCSDTVSIIDKKTFCPFSLAS
jgi:hypothetical protein